MIDPVFLEHSPMISSSTILLAKVHREYVFSQDQSVIWINIGRLWMILDGLSMSQRKGNTDDITPDAVILP